LVLAAPLGTAFTYQGRLHDGTNAANDLYDLDFALFDAPTSGSQLGLSVTLNGQPVSNGPFTVTLDFGASPFTGEARWLQIQVRTNGSRLTPFTPLSPRQPLTPSSNALYAPNAGTALATAAGVVSNLCLAPGAVTSDKIADGTVTSADLSPALASNTFWRLGGNAGTVPGPQFLGTTDNQPLEIQVNGQRALRLEPGFNEAPNVVGGSTSNRLAADRIGGTIAGGGSMGSPKRIEGNFGSIGGGSGKNLQFNTFASLIAGGTGNTIQSNAQESVISGGSRNTFQSKVLASLIAGGDWNIIQPTANYSAIGGGFRNTIEADARFSSIGGSSTNIIKFNALAATIGGGNRNLIQFFAEDATIGGGASNNVGYYSISSIIGGGSGNRIGEDAPYATVPGGLNNLAAGRFSLAAGCQAQALHFGAFVWADGTVQTTPPPEITNFASARAAACNYPPPPASTAAARPVRC
jgi:hypothetical protein